MKHYEGDYVLLSDIKDVDELNAVHDALVAGSGAIPSHKYPYSASDKDSGAAIYINTEGAVARTRTADPRWAKRRLTVDQVLVRTPAYSYIVMDGTVEVSGPMSYEDACKKAKEFAAEDPGISYYTVCMLCRVFKGRVVVDESEYGELSSD